MNDTDPAARALARVLNLTDQKKLPSVPWEGWCQESGIESPALARTFLNELARLYYQKSEAALLRDSMAESVNRGKGPYVYWIWKITPDFRMDPQSRRVNKLDQA